MRIFAIIATSGLLTLTAYAAPARAVVVPSFSSPMEAVSVMPSPDLEQVYYHRNYHHRHYHHRRYYGHRRY
jgi:hypothetical protein